MYVKTCTYCIIDSGSKGKKLYIQVMNRENAKLKNAYYYKVVQWKMRSTSPMKLGCLEFLASHRITLRATDFSCIKKVLDLTIVNSTVVHQLVFMHYAKAQK